MTTALLPDPVRETSDRLIASWRLTADADNPAGPLFTSGRFAASDIAAPHMQLDTIDTCWLGCSTCTASRRYFCC